MNSTREEQPPEVEVFLWVGSRSGWIKLRSDAATMVASSTYIGPGPLPNIEREGSQQRRADLEGDS